MPKLNICVVGLEKDLTDKVCTELAKLLELYYANVEKILEFELFDYDNIEKICGRDYLLKEEKSIIRRLCTYENTLINLNYFSLNNDEIINNVKEHCLVIYLHFTIGRVMEKNDNVFDISLFNDRANICTNAADIVIDCKDLNINEITNLTVKNIIKYYS